MENRWQLRGSLHRYKYTSHERSKADDYPERVSLTINVRDTGLVITLRPVVAKTGGIVEATVISSVDSNGDAIGSVGNVGERIAPVSSAVARSPTDSGW